MVIWLIVCSLLHKTPLVQPQPAGLSWAAQRCRPHIYHPSCSSVVETPRIYTIVHVRLSTWRHVPSHASAHATLRLTRVLSNTFRNSVTIALQAFHKVFWPNSDSLAPSSRSLHLGCTLRGFCSFRRHPCHCVNPVVLFNCQVFITWNKSYILTLTAFSPAFLLLPNHYVLWS